MSAPALIALNGYARSGKNEAARALTDHGWRQAAFADVLREFALATNPAIPLRARHGSGHITLRRLIGLIGWERAKDEHPEVRLLLQRLGTDAGRRLLGADVWVHAAMAGVEPGELVVFTDCRFRSEAEAVRERGGIIVRVDRPGVGPVNNHVSEIELDDYEHFAARITNGGTVAQLHERVHALVHVPTP